MSIARFTAGGAGQAIAVPQQAAGAGCGFMAGVKKRRVGTWMDRMYRIQREKDLPD